MKERILDNVAEFSPQELVNYIKQGVVTFHELCEDTDGEFSARARKEVQRLLNGNEAEDWENALASNTAAAFDSYVNAYPNSPHYAEAVQRRDALRLEEQRAAANAHYEQAWLEVDTTSEESLQKFIQENPDHGRVPEARALLNELMMEGLMGVDAEALALQIQQIGANPLYTPDQKVYNTLEAVRRYVQRAHNGKSDLLQLMADDFNLFSAGMVKELIDDGMLSLADLQSIGIHPQFLRKMLEQSSAKRLNPPKYRLEQIGKQSTEIYFWGIPSSGKTCALGAVLSVAASGRVAKSMDPEPNSQGYGYMMQLINMFRHGQVGELMEGTAVDAFYEMGFDLVGQDNKLHPITCIDMAGELMRCMYKANSGDMLNTTEEEMLETLRSVLGDRRTKNRKLHVFVIEYGAEQREYDGLTQDIYLSGATSYIKQTGIFNKDTDAVYIMITKADKAKTNNPSVFQDYIETHYRGFYQNLQQICQDNEINGGRVEKFAFSLGTVCFQNYCLFNEAAAANVVNIILNRSYGQKIGKAGFFGRMFRG